MFLLMYLFIFISLFLSQKHLALLTGTGYDCRGWFTGKCFSFCICWYETMLDRNQDTLTETHSMIKLRSINYCRPAEPDVTNGNDCSPFVINGSIFLSQKLPYLRTQQFWCPVMFQMKFSMGHFLARKWVDAQNLNMF